MTARRLRPIEHEAIDLRKPDPRLVWAKSARASSEWSSSYAARTACGLPTIYPEGGDRSPAWLAANDDRAPWIELTFPRCDTPRAILICETCGAGAVSLVKDVSTNEVLHRAVPRLTEPAREARLLVIALEAGTRAISKLRIEVAPYSLGSEYKEIDAVALSAVPFDELAQPHVPPPTKEELLVRWRGTLVGVSKERPIVHALVGTGGTTLARSRGTEVKLRLDDGALLDVDVEEAIVYDGRTTRRAGKWKAIASELPILAQLFGEAAPPSEAKVRVELRSIERDVEVEIAGEPKTRETAGFRDEAGPRTHAIEARAIARGLLTSTPFGKEGLGGFTAMREEIAKPSGDPHPLRDWAIGIWITSVVAGALAAWAVSAGDEISIAFTVAFFVWHLAHALELTGGLAAIPPLVARHLDDRRPPFGKYLWTYAIVWMSLCVAGPLIGGVLALVGPTRGLHAGLAIGGLVACVRLGYALRAYAPTLRDVLRVTTRARGDGGVGTWVRRDGELGDATIRRSEDYVAKARHLGTDHYTDAKGVRQSHDRFETWYERHVTVRSEESIELFLDDGSMVRAAAAPRSTDLTLVHVGKDDGREGDFFARFRGVHTAGDSASLYGRVSHTEPGVLVLDDAVLVLDPRRQLGWRCAVHITSLVLLACLAVSGLAALVAIFVGAS